MTKAIITLTICLTLGNNILAQSSSTVRTILDSLEILKNAGGFADGISNPPTTEESRFYNITRMLWGLPFTKANKLMENKNKFARVYGFSVVTKNYFDSLNKSDLQIFNDTAKLPLYTPYGIIDVDITVGQYCEMAHTSTIEEHQNLAKEKDVVASIKQFIKANSQYPDTYEPIAFTNYNWGGNEDDLFFEIQHKYKLKQVDGKPVDVTNYFILDKQFQIMLIEISRSTTIKVDPPQIEEWVNKFGKAK